MTLDPRARSQTSTATRLAQITGVCPHHAVRTAIFAVAEYLSDRVDQDWDNEATRITFEDRSVLVFSGPCVSAEDKSDD
jgi:hypothetical protein|tara:strand:- start:1423 stop:1659 length:237 start_codon:yes stop_codon:yes gene_type:complete